MSAPGAAGLGATIEAQQAYQNQATQQAPAGAYGQQTVAGSYAAGTAAAGATPAGASSQWPATGSATAATATGSYAGATSTYGTDAAGAMSAGGAGVAMTTGTSGAAGAGGTAGAYSAGTAGATGTYSAGTPTVTAGTVGTASGSSMGVASSGVGYSAGDAYTGTGYSAGGTAVAATGGQGPTTLTTTPYLTTTVTTTDEDSDADSHRSPTEFTGNGGPAAIAGTKLVSADDDNDAVVRHPPAQTPPPEYSQENPPVTIYMYRAQSLTDYPMRNVNLADLAGVLWYLHNEILGFPDKVYKIRHFNISRVIRFKVTIQNPPEYFKEHHARFSAFTSFGAGKCNLPRCQEIWNKYGAVVGCQKMNKKTANYSDNWQTLPWTADCDECNGAIWYSLPGPCPAHEYGAKSADCAWNNPGGDCGRDNPVTGARDCTYFAEWYGEIFLDEILNYTREDGSTGNFVTFTDDGGQEYDRETDKGTLTDFWDGIHDGEANKMRMEAFRNAFHKKYPKYPLEQEEKRVLCDFDGWHDDEFGEGVRLPGGDW